MTSRWYLYIYKLANLTLIHIIDNNINDFMLYFHVFIYIFLIINMVCSYFVKCNFYHEFNVIHIIFLYFFSKNFK